MAAPLRNFGLIAMRSFIHTRYIKPENTQIFFLNFKILCPIEFFLNVHFGLISANKGMFAALEHRTRETGRKFSPGGLRICILHIFCPKILPPPISLVLCSKVAAIPLLAEMSPKCTFKKNSIGHNILKFKKKFQRCPLATYKVYV